MHSESKPASANQTNHQPATADQKPETISVQPAAPKAAPGDPDGAVPRRPIKGATANNDAGPLPLTRTAYAQNIHALDRDASAAEEGNLAIYLRIGEAVDNAKAGLKKRGEFTRMLREDLAHRGKTWWLRLRRLYLRRDDLPEARKWALSNPPDKPERSPYSVDGSIARLNRWDARPKAEFGSEADCAQPKPSRARPKENWLAKRNRRYAAMALRCERLEATVCELGGEPPPPDAEYLELAQ